MGVIATNTWVTCSGQLIMVSTEVALLDTVKKLLVQLKIILYCGKRNVM